MITSDTFQTSLWMSTALPPPETKTLTENLNTQVVVVGAGFTGLSAALHLRELGYEVVVLEAKEIGFGASGRNGGQVISGLKIDPNALVKRFGNEKASQIFCATESSADLVFNLVKKYKLSCELKRTGLLYASENSSMLDKSRSRVNWLNNQGIGAEMLGASETASRIGHHIYTGSMYDPRGGALNPLSYVRELASAALSNGAQIYTDSAAETLKRSGEK
jgi:glycine/D-amino acid oxidase-like deaminating enzyme